MMHPKLINDRYVVMSHLGRGSQGDVLLALDQKLDRHVAIKIIHNDGALNQEVKQRLRREAIVMARFQHSNVVSVHDYDITHDNNWPFLVMEYLEGDTLEAIDPPLRDSEILLMVKQVGDALQHAHERGLVHRDLKPANMMYVDRNRVSRRFMILDLGIAKLSDVAKNSMNSIANLTYSGAGTPSFMAPEQIQGQEVDHRADIYALASILYTLFSGKTPFEPYVHSLHALLNAVAVEEPATLSKVANRACSEKMSRLIMESLSKDPALRPQDMNTFVSRFSACYKTPKKASEKRPAIPTKLEAPSQHKQQANAPAPSQPRSDSQAAESELPESEVANAGSVGLQQHRKSPPENKEVANPNAAIVEREVVDAIVAPSSDALPGSDLENREPNPTDNSNVPIPVEPFYQGYEAPYPPGNDSQYPPGADSQYPPGADSQYPPGADSHYPPATDSRYPQGTDSHYPPGPDSRGGQSHLSSPMHSTYPGSHGDTYYPNSPGTHNQLDEDQRFFTSGNLRAILIAVGVIGFLFVGLIVLLFIMSVMTSI